MAERTSNLKNISRRVSDNQWENATDIASNFLVPSIVVIVQMKETNFISNGWTYE